MPYIKTNDGVQLYYESVGEGTPILFVHEYAGDHRSWEPQMRYFARNFRCIAYSARGYTPSDIPTSADDYSQHRVSEDIRCMLDGLNIRQAHIVGLSMGAFATLHFGMRYATDPANSRALSLTLAGCGTGSHPSAYEGFQQESLALADRIQAEGMAEVAKTYSKAPARLAFKRKDPRGYEEFARMMGEHSTPGSSLTARGYQGRRPSLYALTDQIARVAVPTLVLTGDEDEPCLEPSLMLKRTIPGAALGIFPASGHGINLEEPALFNQMLSDFLMRVTVR
jgi:pimeloyl-ACP methyl ester carboxylesterase